METSGPRPFTKKRSTKNGINGSGSPWSFCPTRSDAVIASPAAGRNVDGSIQKSCAVAAPDTPKANAARRIKERAGRCMALPPIRTVGALRIRPRSADPFSALIRKRANGEDASFRHPRARLPPRRQTRARGGPPRGRDGDRGTPPLALALVDRRRVLGARAHLVAPPRVARGPRAEADDPASRRPRSRARRRGDARPPGGRPPPQDLRRRAEAPQPRARRTLAPPRPRGGSGRAGGPSPRDRQAAVPDRARTRPRRERRADALRPDDAAVPLGRPLLRRGLRRGDGRGDAGDERRRGSPLRARSADRAGPLGAHPGARRGRLHRVRRLVLVVRARPRRALQSVSDSSPAVVRPPSLAPLFAPPLWHHRRHARDERRSPMSDSSPFVVRPEALQPPVGAIPEAHNSDAGGERLPTGAPAESARRGVDCKALLERLAGGDQSALAALFDATSRPVYGLALRLLGDPADAEEVTLDVYTQAWRQVGRYDASRGDALTWLLTLTRSLAIHRLRSPPGSRKHQQALDTAP